MLEIAINQVCIVGSFLLAGLVSILVFYKHRKNSKRHHLEIMKGHQNQLEKNEHQIQFRKVMIAKYDFLKYNLQEALMAQPEILLLK